MALWGEFQSLIQLSTGLNTALAALSDFFGSASRDEPNRARRLATRVQKLKSEDQDTSNYPTYDGMAGELIILEGRANTIHEKFSSYIHRWIRPICIGMSFMTIILLIVSSYFYNSTIEPAFQILVILSMTPFIAGILKAIILSTQARGGSREIEGLYAVTLRVERSVYETKSGRQ